MFLFSTEHLEQNCPYNFLGSAQSDTATHLNADWFSTKQGNGHAKRKDVEWEGGRWNDVRDGRNFCAVGASLEMVGDQDRVDGINYAVASQHVAPVCHYV